MPSRLMVCVPLLPDHASNQAAVDNYYRVTDRRIDGLSLDCRSQYAVIATGLVGLKPTMQVRMRGLPLMAVAMCAVLASAAVARSAAPTPYAFVAPLLTVP